MSTSGMKSPLTQEEAVLRQVREQKIVPGKSLTIVRCPSEKTLQPSDIKLIRRLVGTGLDKPNIYFGVYEGINTTEDGINKSLKLSTMKDSIPLDNVSTIEKISDGTRAKVSIKLDELKTYELPGGAIEANISLIIKAGEPKIRFKYGNRTIDTELGDIEKLETVGMRYEYEMKGFLKIGAEAANIKITNGSDADNALYAASLMDEVSKTPGFGPSYRKEALFYRASLYENLAGYYSKGDSKTGKKYHDLGIKDLQTIVKEGAGFTEEQVVKKARYILDGKP